MDEKKRRKVIVGLETAVDGGSISVIENGEEIDWVSGNESFSRLDDFTERIDRILVKNNISRRDIERICVSKGPGSLTGIRIGMALALGLGNSLQREVVRISIPDALRFGSVSRGKLVTAFCGRESVVYFKEFAQVSEDLPNDTNVDVSKSGFMEFLKKLKVCMAGGDYSFVMTENLFQLVEKELREETFWTKQNINIAKVGGSFARIIAIAGSRENASGRD